MHVLVLVVEVVTTTSNVLAMTGQREPGYFRAS